MRRDRIGAALVCFGGHLGVLTIYVPVLLGIWQIPLLVGLLSWAVGPVIYLAGLVPFWKATRWTLKEKLVGTFAWPAALLWGPLVMLLSSGLFKLCEFVVDTATCESYVWLGPVALTLAATGLLAPLVVGSYLLFRTRRVAQEGIA